MAVYSSVLEVDPSNVHALSNRGLVRRKLSTFIAVWVPGWFIHVRWPLEIFADDFEGAIGDYSQALRVDPLNIKAFNNRAYCFAKLERFDEAIQDYSSVIDIGEFWYNCYACSPDSHFLLLFQTRAMHMHSTIVVFRTTKLETMSEQSQISPR